jgi:cbb3-type cytochrome oxidase cytochrome c subunit
VETEESKRKRSSAASARFRQRKKQREQDLEKTARDMTERATQYEARIRELEAEVAYLRKLIVDIRNSASTSSSS